MSIATWQAEQERSVYKFIQDEIGALRKAYDNSTAEIDRLRGVLSEIRKISADFSIPVMDRIDQCFDMSYAALADGEGVGK